MGLDYEEYAKELRRVELENEALGGYGNDEPDNEPQQQQEMQQSEIHLNKEPQGRKIHGAPKQPAKDEWAD